MVNSKTIEEFRAFGLPGVMIVFGRASKRRKKSEPELYVFYGNLNYKLKRIVGKSPFSGSIQNDNLRAFVSSDKQIRIILHQTSLSPCLLLPRCFFMVVSTTITVPVVSSFAPKHFPWSFRSYNKNVVRALPYYNVLIGYGVVFICDVWSMGWWALVA